MSLDAAARAVLCAGLIAAALPWAFLAFWTSLGAWDNGWESTCYEGQPLFAAGQAALALAGLLAASPGIAFSVHRRRNPYPWLLGAYLVLAVWFLWVTHAPERTIIPMSNC